MIPTIESLEKLPPEAWVPSQFHSLGSSTGARFIENRIEHTMRVQSCCFDTSTPGDPGHLQVTPDFPPGVTVHMNKDRDPTFLAGKILVPGDILRITLPPDFPTGPWSVALIGEVLSPFAVSPDPA
jgi:hypothetical protein